MGIPEPNVTVAPGDVEKGAKIFKTKCAQCHNADKVRCRWGVRGRPTGEAGGPEASMRPEDSDLALGGRGDS